MKNTIYIIHGWTYTTEPWQKTLSLLKDAGIDAKMLNVPGLTTKSNKVWTIDDYVAWADQNIPDGAIALGHSNGGRILLNLLAKKPEKLKHLVLLDSAGVYEESTKRNVARKASKTFAPLKRVKLFRKVYHKLLGASDYDRAPENMKRTLTNMLDSDKNLKLDHILTPTTILWGEADTITPLRQGQELNRRLKNSEFYSYKNWTHAPYICDPSGLARALEKTIGGIK